MAAVADPVRASFTFSIDVECPVDVPAREALLDRAMGAGRRRKSSEKIRRGRIPAEGMALAARDADETLVGTVRLWNVEIGRDAVTALLLGPLAVDRRAEGRGVGGALMRAAIEKARAAGHGAIVLVGDPDYYRRFGFSSDLTQGLAMPGPFERHRLLALELREGWLEAARGVIAPSGRMARTARRLAA